MIALIDYGAGNLTSVRKALTAVGAEFCTPAAPEDLATADGIIVPGVGHFAATRAIGEAWRRAILDAVDRKTPLLGICLGLQYLFDGSEEAPGVRGLGLLPGSCTRLPPTLKVPHVGWNALTRMGSSCLLDGIADGTQVYFTHSYAAPITDACVAATTHSAPFAAAVEHGHIFGAQFHPEKSGQPGLRVLRSFVEITKSPNHEITRCSPDA
jgi:imidazole glycerol-phosphate synthase subunit HisH